MQVTVIEGVKRKNQGNVEVVRPACPQRSDGKRRVRVHDVEFLVTEARLGEKAGMGKKRPCHGKILGPKPVTGGEANHAIVVIFVALVAGCEDQDAMAARAEFSRG